MGTAIVVGIRKVDTSRQWVPWVAEKKAVSQQAMSASGIWVNGRPAIIGQATGVKITIEATVDGGPVTQIVNCAGLKPSITITDCAITDLNLTSGEITVCGNSPVGKISTTSASVSTTSEIKGGVETISGPVQAAVITGNCKTTSGDITADTITGKPSTMTGKIVYKRGRPTGIEDPPSAKRQQVPPSSVPSSMVVDPDEEVIIVEPELESSNHIGSYISIDTGTDRHGRIFSTNIVRNVTFRGGVGSFHVGNVYEAPRKKKSTSKSGE